jgi:predicted SAM-dependent methyltransferase
MIALNFGCGTDRIIGWQNFDAELDISKRLPFPDGHADFVLAEHVVEHIEYNLALSFFRECRRVLKPQGVVRIAVPSIERVWYRGDDAYFRFVQARGWSKAPDTRGAIEAMLTCHGHKAPWTASLLSVSLYAAGFDHVAYRNCGLSDHPELRGVEGHSRVIGNAFNEIETVICEGSSL